MNFRRLYERFSCGEHHRTSATRRKKQPRWETGFSLTKMTHIHSEVDIVREWWNGVGTCYLCTTPPTNSSCFSVNIRRRLTYDRFNVNVIIGFLLVIVASLYLKTHRLRRPRHNNKIAAISLLVATNKQRW